MNPFASFLVGPYGQAFALMDEYQFLPTPECFTEFTEEMYEAYYVHKGMPAERLFQMNTGPQYRGKEILTVSKTEKEEILKARQFVDSVISSNPSLKGASDEECINYFKSRFSFFFPDHKLEDK
jgi:hypothetical protein